LTATHAVVMLITDHSVSVHVLQVTLPDTLKGRWCHSTTIVHTGSTLKKLVNYGGMYEPPRNWRDPGTYISVAETTVIEIGKCMVTFCTIYATCCILVFMTLATYENDPFQEGNGSHDIPHMFTTVCDSGL